MREPSAIELGFCLGFVTGVAMCTILMALTLF